MASYHFHLTQVKRSRGQSVIAQAAYRAGEKLYSTYYGESSDFTRKRGVVMAEICLPDHAPREYADRETLWNALEWAESGRKAQLAHSFDITLMNEFSMEENIEMARAFVQEELVARGMIADFAIHDPVRPKGAEPNPHIHILVPIRPLKEDGTWGIKEKKISVMDEQRNPVLDKNGKQAYRAVSTTGWSSKEMLIYLRKNWENRCNEKFKEKGLAVRVDARSFKERGIDRIPMIHEGPHVRAMEAKGIRTALGNLNRLISQFNQIAMEITVLKSWISEKIYELKRQMHYVQKPTLAGYLQQYYDERNRVARTYQYGSQKAMNTNLKQLAETIAFLSDENIDTPEELEQRIRELSSRGHDLQYDLDEADSLIREMKKLIKAWDDYETFRPVYEEYKNKFFGKEKFKKEHAKELNRYHRGKRIVMGNRNEEGKVPISNWKKYLKNATGEKETLEAEKKEVLEKLRPLQKVQRSVDLVMMEIEDQPDPENLLAEEKTACRDQIQKKDRVKKKSYGVEL